MNPKYIMLRDNVERITNEENEYKKLKNKGFKLIGGTEFEKLKAEGDKKAQILRAEGEKESAILVADAKKTAQIKEAEGKAEAILKIKEAEANGIKLLKDAKADDAVLKLKSYETFAKVADGQATKIIIPSNLQDMTSVISVAKEIIKEKK